MTQVTVFSGAQRRRYWSVDQKQALVEAAFTPGAHVAEVARRADLVPSQIYRWRRELGMVPSPHFAAVAVRADQEVSGAAMLIEVSGSVIRISASAPPALVAAALKALR